MKQQILRNRGALQENFAEEADYSLSVNAFSANLPGSFKKTQAPLERTIDSIYPQQSTAYYDY
jgi:hypothetical protein